MGVPPFKETPIYDLYPFPGGYKKSPLSLSLSSQLGNVVLVLVEVETVKVCVVSVVVAVVPVDVVAVS